MSWVLMSHDPIMISEYASKLMTFASLFETDRQYTQHFSPDLGSYVLKTLVTTGNEIEPYIYIYIYMNTYTYLYI